MKRGGCEATAYEKSGRGGVGLLRRRGEGTSAHTAGMLNRLRLAFARLVLPVSCSVALLGCAATKGAKVDAPTAVTSSLCTATVARTWHGRVANARADEYAKYLGEAITKFRAIAGNRGYQMMRESIGEETHFTVISYWDSASSIVAYAGAEILKTHHLPRDAEFLIDPEETVKNYELVVNDVGCAAPAPP